MVRETGRRNRVAVLSRDKTDVSRGGGINDRGKINRQHTGLRWSPPPNILLLRKLSYDIKIRTYLALVLPTIHVFDRQTDSFLVARPPCIQCSAVKTNIFGVSDCL